VVGGGGGGPPALAFCFYNPKRNIYFNVLPQ
jgi:hypothetical protein